MHLSPSTLARPRSALAVDHDGDITYDDVYNAAKTLRHRSMARTMAGTVKEILGTCQSVGCTVDGKVSPPTTPFPLPFPFTVLSLYCPSSLVRAGTC